MGSLNKKYRNYRARLKADYYDIESTDEERLKEENRPPNVDKDDWEWLVEYFGSDEFKVITYNINLFPYIPPRSFYFSFSN